MAGPYVGPMLEVLRAVCDHLERVERKTTDLEARADRAILLGNAPAWGPHGCNMTGCNYPEGECSGACGWAPTTGKG